MPSEPSPNKNILSKLFKYGLRNLNWKPFITVENKRHKLVIRGLIDEKGEVYGDKVGRWDVVVDGVIGPDAEDLKKLGEYVKEVYPSNIYMMFLEAMKELEVF